LVTKSILSGSCAVARLISSFAQTCMAGVLACYEISGALNTLHPRSESIFGE
jgi:hypothetical protein